MEGAVKESEHHEVVLIMKNTPGKASEPLAMHGVVTMSTCLGEGEGLGDGDGEGDLSPAHLPVQDASALQAEALLPAQQPTTSGGGRVRARRCERGTSKAVMLKP